MYSAKSDPHWFSNRPCLCVCESNCGDNYLCSRYHIRAPELSCWGLLSRDPFKLSKMDDFCPFVLFHVRIFYFFFTDIETPVKGLCDLDMTLTMRLTFTTAVVTQLKNIPLKLPVFHCLHLQNIVHHIHHIFPAAEVNFLPDFPQGRT